MLGIFLSPSFVHEIGSDKKKRIDSASVLQEIKNVDRKIVSGDFAALSANGMRP